MKNWVVFELVEDIMGYEEYIVDRFETEAEARIKVLELEREDLDEYGQIVNDYYYYHDDLED